MSNIAERVVNYLMDVDLLVEDRIDDIITKHGARIPGSTPEAKRHTISTWAAYDPTYRAATETRPEKLGKYLPWMVKQFLTGKATWDEHQLDHVRDMLFDFEHYLTMPQFEHPRDIYQYDYTKLDSTLQSVDLASKKDIKRGRERRDANVLNQIGDLSLVAFKDGNSLSEEGWRAYSPENPNWKGKPHLKTDPEYQQGQEPYSVDHLWCIRNPQRGSDYISHNPAKEFYVVQKGGWPYVGMVLNSDWGSQIVDLENKSVSAKYAEELYDLVKPTLDLYASKGWNPGSAASNLFGKLRIIRGEIKDGETIQSADLSGSSLKALPNNLTVNGNLNVSGTKLKALPNNLTVNGDLVISDTAINALPPGLKVSGGLNLSGSKIKSLPQGMKIGNLDISNTAISQLPSGLTVTETLKINGTPISKLPQDLRATKVFYSPETLSESEIRAYFFFLRQEDLKKHFFKSPQVAGKTDEEKEQAWIGFIPSLQAHFQKAPNIGQAAAAMFEPVRAEAATRRRR